MRVQVIIPVYYPDNKFIELLVMIKKQTVKNIHVLIIDSGSDGKYQDEIHDITAEIIKINSNEFNHGGTRQMGIDRCNEADIFIFLTQDAILFDEYAIELLIDAFKNKRVGCAYGRQIPHKDADVFASIARLYNYPKNSYIRSFEDRRKYGIKTVFISNSFAAYRKEAMENVGGFPSNTILGEDMYVAAKMVIKKWEIAYKPESIVYHSHNYTIMQEFRRYFDIGAFQRDNPWIHDNFGRIKGEGKKFLLYAIHSGMLDNCCDMIIFFIRNLIKFIGYELGLHKKYLPLFIKKYISMYIREKYINRRA